MWVGSSPGGDRIQCSQRAGAANVVFNPVTAGGGDISCQVHASIDPIAAVTAWGFGSENVEQAGEFAADPVGQAVLIVDIIDSKAAAELLKICWCFALFCSPQGLCKIGLPAPDTDVERIFGCCGIDLMQQPAGGFCVESIADCRASAKSIAGTGARQQFFGRGPVIGVLQQAGAYLSKGIHNFPDEFGARDGFLKFSDGPGGRCDQQADVELIGVEHQPDEGLLIIGVTADVCEYRQPGPLLLCIGGREAADGEWHKQDEQQFAEHWCDPQGHFRVSDWRKAYTKVLKDSSEVLDFGRDCG